MDHPKKQISHVINLLCEGSPVDQKHALDTYFLPDASFTHPLCRVPSFSHVALPLIGEINSRWVIWMVYRWYKILSPRILLTVKCEEFNQKSQILFVDITQRFSPIYLPFYRPDVHLTTKLHLVQDSETQKYHIASQEDLYQTNELLRFVLPGGATLLWVWQLFATFLCTVGAVLLAPVTWVEQRQANVKMKGNGAQTIL